MTRINVGIPVRRLSDAHLRTEYEEITRIPKIYKYRIEKGIGFTDIPKKFNLRTGHVIFFLDKGRYTLNRYKELYSEMIRRDIGVGRYRESDWEEYLPEHFKDYIPEKRDSEIIIKRISEKIILSEHLPHYFGRTISKEEAISILKGTKNEKVSN